MTKRPGKVVQGVGVCLALAAVVWIARAGSLEPPGPPAPTMKPLDVVEARTPLSNASLGIPAPGSYYLVEDLTAAAATGLSIGADDVTLDLNGFAIVGAATPDVHGINVADASNVTIRNGTIRGFDRGIDVQASTDVRLVDLRVLANVTDGINGFDSTVEIDACNVEGNGAAGISLSADFFNVTDSLIRHSTIARNGADGITADATLLEIRDNIVQNNGERGIEISMTNAKLIGNVVDLNADSGIFSAIAAGVITENLCFNNGIGGTGYGIEVVLAEAGQLITRNQAGGNATDDYMLDASASAAPISMLDASTGPWDNLIPTPAP